MYKNQIIGIKRDGNRELMNEIRIEIKNGFPLFGDTIKISERNY